MAISTSVRKLTSRLWVGLTLTAASLLVSASSSAPPVLIDIDTTVPIEGSSPGALGTLGSWTLFHANGLWRTDGTHAGTSRLFGGRNFRTYGKAVVLGGVSYFLASDADAPVGLWRTDATAAGTHRIMPVGAGFTDGPHVVGALNGGLIISAYEDIAPALLRSDGTAHGTVKIGNRYVRNGGFAITGGKLLFASSPHGLANGADTLWVTDGTAAGTRQLAVSQPFFSAADFMVLGGRVLFSAANADGVRRLWSVEIATETAELIDVTVNVRPVLLQGTVIFAGSAGDPAATGDVEPWRSDGTTAGTARIADLTPGTAGSPITSLVSIGQRAVFLMNGSPWSTDGTAPGTTALNAPATYAALRAAGGFAYIFQNTVGPAALTDGTPAGTRVLIDMVTAPGTFDVIGDSSRAYVLSNTRLLRHDPATNQTVALHELPFPGSPAYLLDTIGSSLLWSRETAANGLEPWISDGARAGTALLVDANPADHTASANPNDFTLLDGTLYFSAGNDIWRSNGTAAGTRVLHEPGFPVDELSASGGYLYYRTNHAVQTAPRFTYRRIRPGDAAEEVTDEIYYAAVDPPPRVQFRGRTLTICLPPARTARTLCELDTSGTLQPVPGLPDKRVSSLAAAGDRFYFAMEVTVVAETRTRLFVGDGTSSGSKLVASLVDVHDLTSIDGRLYFSAKTPSGDTYRAYVSENATPTAIDLNAPQPAAFLRIDSGVFVASRDLRAVTFRPDVPNAGAGWSQTADQVFKLEAKSQVVLRDATTDAFEIWASDGLVANTIKLQEFPRSLYSRVDSFFMFNGRVTFFASALSGMVEIWQTDGTPAGTLRLEQIEGFDPGEPTPWRRKLYFAATAHATGRELYVLTDPSTLNTAPTAVADPAVSVQAGGSVLLDVLANDRDDDGTLDRSSVRIVRQPSLGTVQIESGRIRYLARSEESGGDSFSYVVADDEGRDSDPAIAAVTIERAPASNPIPPAVSNPGRAGGGGSMLPGTLMILLLFAFLSMRRRR